MPQPAANTSKADLTSTPTTTTTTATSTSTSSPSPTLSTASTDPLGFVWDLKANPCFRSSLMWGIGLGTALGVHSFSRHRLPYKASDTAVKSFFVVSSLSWLWCRHQARREKELFDAVINLEMSARQGRKGGVAGSDGKAVQGQSAAVAPVVDSI